MSFHPNNCNETKQSKNRRLWIISQQYWTERAKGYWLGHQPLQDRNLKVIRLNPTRYWEHGGPLKNNNSKRRSGKEN